MSGLLGEVPTPCPSRLRTSRFDRSSDGSDSLSSNLWGDSLNNFEDTGNIDFTTQIKAPVLTGSKPRRRTKTSSAFAIHDDDDDDDTQDSHAQAANKRRKENESVGAPSHRKTSLLAQPAQRFRPRVSLATSPTTTTNNLSRQQGETAPKTQITKRDSEKNRELLMRINGREQAAHCQQDALKRDVRRNTVYIPPDDTTVASVFMGMFSPIKSGGPEYQPSEDTQINSLQSQVARKRQAKRSLASSAQRVPLQPSLKVAQEGRVHVDVVGKNGGKENIPPGTVLGSKGKSSQPVKILEDADAKWKGLGPRVTRADPAKPLAAKSVNGSLQNAVRNVKGASLNDSRNENDGVKRKLGPRSRSSTLESPLNSSRTGMSLSKNTAPRSSKKAVAEYPLAENIANPALYEDDWVSHQEIVLMQLVNGLFDHTDTKSKFNDPAALRKELLALYQTTSFVHFHKRVQASLLYGALSIPKDVLTRDNRLTQDVGMKRKFLDFWMQTYNLKALRAAVEAVTGRKISGKATQDTTHDSQDSSSEKVLKRRVEHFLDTFLLQNQDMDHRARELDTDAVGRSYRRTVLRSIMMIVLLDKAVGYKETALPTCLFLSSSPFKSSAAVLQGLARFLIPSCGDVIKALHHLDCELSYEQRPLQEYEYQISNLAVDLRDGVRLTRLVELLLFPASRLDNVEHKRPLSQRLKFPCLSRTVKVFNVQVALNALSSTIGSRKIVNTVRAEDIVNGHREKTIALLWGLVSKWGLAGLVDWDDVRTEIDRLKQKASQKYGYEEIKDEPWFTGDMEGLDESDQCVLLLKQWASILAQLNGLCVENLSSSFGDGKIYESIMVEYEHLLELTSADTQPPTLATRLQALGCSAEFATLVHPGPSKSHILDRDCTVGALAFLCSRLLPVSKLSRAAIVVQKAWRRVLARRDLQRRTMARAVALQCAAVVQARDHILWAKEVIVQWWRRTAATRRRQRRNMTGSRDAKTGALRGQQRRR